MAVLILVHTIVWQSEISLKTEWGGAGLLTHLVDAWDKCTVGRQLHSYQVQFKKNLDASTLNYWK